MIVLPGQSDKESNSVYFLRRFFAERSAVMSRWHWIVALSLMALNSSTAQEVRLRVQRAGDVTYFQVIIPAPADLQLPASLGQAIEKMPLVDLERRPELSSRDQAISHLVWRSKSNATTLEFLGRCRTDRANARLRYSVERDDKAAWIEKELTLDFAKAEKLPPAAPKDDDNVVRLWAMAQAHEWAALERLSGGCDYFRFAHQAICRQHAIANPLPRPAVAPAKKEAAERTIGLSRLPEIEPAEHPWTKLLADRKPIVEPLAKWVPSDFFYLRVAPPQQLDRLLTTLSFLNVLTGESSRDTLRERYQRQCCFPADSRGRPRLPGQVAEFAVVGRDLQFTTGTDVTFLFRLSNEAGFRAESDAAIAAVRKNHDLNESREEYRGLQVQSFASANRTISLHRT